MLTFTKKSLQGMTLVELLISLLLGSILLLMTINTFFVIKKIWLTQQGLVRIQVNARTIDYLLGKAVRNSGAIGCQRLHPDKNLFPNDDFSRYPLVGLHAQDIPKTLRAPRKVMQRMISDSDVLWVQASHHEYPLTMVDNLLARYKAGTIILLADCHSMSAYKIHNNMKMDASSYADSAKLYIFSSTVYYVAESKRKNAQGKPILALYSTDFNGRTLELVEGVAKLRFTYGEKIKGTVQYQPAHAVQDWQQVVSVRLRALLSAIEGQEPVLQKEWYFEWPLLLVN